MGISYMKKFIVVLLSVLFCFGLTGCSSKKTTVENEEEWLSLFSEEKLGNVTIHQSDAYENDTIRFDGNKFYMKVVTLENDYTSQDFIECDGTVWDLYIKEGEEEPYAYKMDMGRTPFEYFSVVLYFGELQNMYSMMTYTEGRGYVYEEGEEGICVQVENGYIRQIVINWVDDTVTMNFTDYGKTRVEIPEHQSEPLSSDEDNIEDGYIVDTDIDLETWNAAFDPVLFTNVMVENENFHDDISEYLIYYIAEEEQYVYRYAMQGEEVSRMEMFLLQHKDGHYSRYLKENDGDYQVTDLSHDEVISTYFDYLYDQFVGMIPKDMSQYTQNEDGGWTTQLQVNGTDYDITLYFSEGKLSEVYMLADNAGHNYYFTSYGTTEMFHPAVN